MSSLIFMQSCLMYIEFLNYCVKELRSLNAFFFFWNIIDFLFPHFTFDFDCFSYMPLQGFAIPKESQGKVAEFRFRETPAQLRHGDVVIAAITSCTNTSNPSVMLGGALVAKKACELGLEVG